MGNLKILVVLYNKQLLESESLATLMQFDKFFGKFELIIWDNSALRLKQEDILEYEKAIFPSKMNYSNTPDNFSLSKIYNLVIKDFIETDDFLMLLDDDTSLKEAFFTDLFTCLEDKTLSADVFLPRILNHQVLVSPAKMYFFLGRYFKEIKSGFLQSRFTVAINSGMIISGKFLKIVFEGYDEELRFYGTDTYFMKELAKVNGSVYILDTFLNHDLSFYNRNLGMDNKIKRLKEMVFALDILMKNESYVVKFFFTVYKIFLKLKYSFRFKSIKLYDNRGSK